MLSVGCWKFNVRNFHSSIGRQPDEGIGDQVSSRLSLIRLTTDATAFDVASSVSLMSGSIIPLNSDLSLICVTADSTDLLTLIGVAADATSCESFHQ
jgi:hypothetical protein